MSLLLNPFYHDIHAKESSDSELRVAVASNFVITIREIAERYYQQTGVKILISSASSGKITTQIEAGAPYDLFLSADTARPKRLVTKGYALPESLKVYAIGQLVLVSRNAIPSSLELDSSRLAIANPKIAPYGLAAQQWLENNNYRPKLILGENINQTWHFFHMGAVPYAIVAASQVIQAKKAPAYQQSIKTDDQVLSQAMVILKRSENLTTAQHFHDFILSQEIQEHINQVGYKTIKAFKISKISN